MNTAHIRSLPGLGHYKICWPNHRAVIVKPRSVCIPRAFWNRRKGNLKQDEASMDITPQEDRSEIRQAQTADQEASAYGNLPPMILEIEVEKGASLHDVAKACGWDVEKLIEANHGSLEVTKDTKLRFQHPLANNPQHLGEMMGLGPSRDAEVPAGDVRQRQEIRTRKILPATEPNPHKPSATRNGLYPPGGWGIWLVGTVFLLGAAKLSQYLSTASAKALQDRAARRRANPENLPSSSDNPSPLHSTQGNIAAAEYTDTEPSSAIAQPGAQASDSDQLRQRRASNSLAGTSLQQSPSEAGSVSEMATDFNFEDPGWLTLPQVYLILTPVQTTPTFKLLPQLADENLLLVYEDEADAQSMLNWYKHNAMHKAGSEGPTNEWFEPQTGKVGGRIQAIRPVAGLKLADVQGHGIACVPSKVLSVEEGMALDDIWLSLLTSSFTLAHKPWQRTQASVQRVLERHNIPTVQAEAATSPQLQPGAPSRRDTTLQSPAAEAERQQPFYEIPQQLSKDVEEIASSFENKMSKTKPGFYPETGLPMLEERLLESEEPGRDKYATSKQPFINPFQQLAAIGKAPSMLMPDSAQADFDLERMRLRFEAETSQHSSYMEDYAFIEVDTTEKGGHERDTLPVPADMREIWQQLQEISLPEESASTDVDELVDFVLEKLYHIADTYTQRKLAIVGGLKTKANADTDEELTACNYRDFLYHHMELACMSIGNLPAYDSVLARLYLYKASFCLKDLFKNKDKGAAELPESPRWLAGRPNTTAYDSAPRKGAGDVLQDTASGSTPDGKNPAARVEAPDRAEKARSDSIRRWKAQPRRSIRSWKSTQAAQSAKMTDERSQEPASDQTQAPAETAMSNSVDKDDIAQEAKPRLSDYEILDSPPEKLRSDRWRDCEQLFILTQREEDGINHLLLNLSESQLVQDPHLISFTDYHDAFAYTQLLRANGDESDFRVVGLAAETVAGYLEGREDEIGVTIFQRNEVPFLEWRRLQITPKELHDKVASAARTSFENAAL